MRRMLLCLAVVVTIGTLLPRAQESRAQQAAIPGVSGCYSLTTWS